MKRHSAKKMDLQSLLRNRNVLYVVLFLATMNLFSYLMMRQLDAVAFFIIIGFLTTYFSKNMIIVMLTSVFSTFFLVQIKLLGKRFEGMEGMDASGNALPAADDEKKEPAVAEKKEAAVAEKKEDTAMVSAPPDAMSTPEIHISKEERAKITASKGATDGMGQTGPKEKFTQQLSPARFNASDDDTTPRHKPKIDYSATLETAYDNLDKLLSSDAIKNMSADTGRLAEKQQQLMGNIDKLAPIMEKASSLLGNLDMGKISGLMGGIQDRFKNFGGGAAAPTDE